MINPEEFMEKVKMSYIGDSVEDFNQHLAEMFVKETGLNYPKNLKEERKKVDMIPPGIKKKPKPKIQTGPLRTVKRSEKNSVVIKSIEIGLFFEKYEKNLCTLLEVQGTFQKN